MLCPNHEREQRIASKSIGQCSVCLDADDSVLHAAKDRHKQIRFNQNLVSSIPDGGSIICPDCGNHCRLNEGEIGFCNLRVAKQGEITHRFQGRAIASWYFDPLPTNCVADWVCPVTKGDPTFTYARRLNNLAVFYGSCNSDCLFCQNDSFRGMMAKGEPLMTPKELAAAANDKTACVCYFGGDPACNPAHSLETSKLLNEERQVRVCYETNGNMSRKWLTQIADIVTHTGGTIKFDLKAVSPRLYTALTGMSNIAVLNNFRFLSEKGLKRDGNLLVASILLVPGYVGISEVSKLCNFINECDPTIPTALLGFHPHHAMSDLPRTSRAHAEAAKEAAFDAGLTNVRIGNFGLLSTKEYPYD
ncbi:MAG: radical SAM protein [Candidatus Thorarchaeota archaeon]|jgi:pyruvate formate lyase activating enzyme